MNHQRRERFSTRGEPHVRHSPTASRFDRCASSFTGDVAPQPVQRKAHDHTLVRFLTPAASTDPSTEAKALRSRKSSVTSTAESPNASANTSRSTSDKRGKSPEAAATVRASASHVEGTSCQVKSTVSANIARVASTRSSSSRWDAAQTPPANFSGGHISNAAVSNTRTMGRPCGFTKRTHRQPSSS